MARPFIARAYWPVVLYVIAYSIGFFAFYPATPTNVDETYYLRQGYAFAHGRTVFAGVDPVTARPETETLDRYVPGTGLLMAPLMLAFGWRGGYLLSLLALAGAGLIMARWLRDEGRSPVWAMLLLCYPSVLVLGRVATSDVVSLGAVTAALWLFWRGDGRGWGWWLGAGLLASLSLLLRQPNAFLYAFFFPGALLRRGRRAWPLVVGGLAGLGIYFGVEHALFGSGVGRENELVLFHLANVWENLPYYALTLLVLVPGGLAAVVLYRGRNRPELIMTVTGLTLVLLAWNSAVAGGMVNKLVLHAPRFALSMVPLLILALAEVAPRLGQRVAAAMPAGRRELLARAARIALGLLIAATIMAGAAVHPLYARWTRSRVAIVEAIAGQTSPGSVLITNGTATSKFINELVMDRVMVPFDLRELTAADVERIRANGYQVFVVILSRSDSAFWRDQDQANRRFREGLAARFNLVPLLDQAYTSTDTLRIWRVESKTD